MPIFKFASLPCPHFGKLTKELDTVKEQTDRLYEAVEKGLLPLDGLFRKGYTNIRPDERKS